MAVAETTKLIQKILEREVFQGDPVLVLDWEVDGEQVKGNLLTLDKEVMSFLISGQGFSYHPNPELQKSLRSATRSTARTDSSYLPFAFLEGMIEIRMDSSQKACTRGNPCGSTCIQKGYGCRVSDPEAKRLGKQVVAHVADQSQPTSNPQKVKHDPEVKEVIAAGEQDTRKIAANPKIQKAMQAYSESKQEVAKEVIYLNETQKKYDKTHSQQEKEKIAKDYEQHYFDVVLPLQVKKEKASQEVDRLLIPEMQKQRTKMLESDPEAQKIAKAKVRAIEVATGDSRMDRQVKEELEEFYTMSGGKPDGISQVHVDPFNDRPYALFEHSYINLGINGKTELRNQGKEGRDQAKSQVFHEVSHFIEAEDPDVLRIAKKWRDKRATGGAKPLSELTGIDGYPPSEIARPDHFQDPYVGKVYPSHLKATEVVSMGAEHFSSPEKMAKLYREDPEHFNLTVGILKRNRRQQR